jgi:hypothetical protein
MPLKSSPLAMLLPREGRDDDEEEEEVEETEAADDVGLDVKVDSSWRAALRPAAP